MSQQNEISELLDTLIACGENMARLGKLLKKEAAAASETHGASDTEAGRTALTKEAPSNNISNETEVKESMAAQEDPASEEAEIRSYSFAEVRRAAASKSHAGFTGQVKALLVKYGADKLSHVKESDYPAFMHDLEVIG